MIIEQQRDIRNLKVKRELVEPHKVENIWNKERLTKNTKFNIISSII